MNFKIRTITRSSKKVYLLQNIASYTLEIFGKNRDYFTVQQTVAGEEKWGISTLKLNLSVARNIDKVSVLFLRENGKIRECFSPEMSIN